ncbi:MAG TPA: hypothetical protein VKY37_07835 [Brumimicrobium sp.]|nr:hypothetical protein [Brumimicrobium sp.]
MKKLLTLILFNSFFSFSQIKDELSQNTKKNLIGFDLSTGVSVHTKKKPGFSFAGAFNYSRISKKRNRYLELGVRYTQLNFSSYKNVGQSLTYKMKYENILLIEIPLGFKKVFEVDEKMRLMVGFNVFYSTYLKWLVRHDVLLSADDSVISTEKGEIKPYTHDKLGLEVGFGFSRHITPLLLFNLSANLTLRSELDLFADQVYVFPNLTFGIRRYF